MRVPPPKKLFGGIVPPNNFFGGGTVPPNNFFGGGTVPPNSFILKIKNYIELSEEDEKNGSVTIFRTVIEGGLPLKLNIRKLVALK